MNKVSSTPSAVKSDSSQTAGHSGEVDVRVALIQALIPLGLDAVNDLLQEEVNDLAGDRYSRKNPDQSIRRWGRQQGSVYLSDQKVPIDVPRVRDVSTDQEVVLEAARIHPPFFFACLQDPVLARIFLVDATNSASLPRPPPPAGGTSAAYS